MSKSHVRRQGRHRKIEFSDLFLWNPILEMELKGESISKFVIDASDNPRDRDILKGLLYDTGRKGRRISDERQRKGISLIEACLARKKVNPELYNGIEEKGSWNAFFAGIPNPSPRFLHILEIEKELKAPTLAFQRKEMQACCDLLKTSCPCIGKHLDEDVFSVLKSIQDPKEFLPYRVMVMLDIQLSLLAYTESIMPPDIDLRRFFPDFKADKFVHPNARFFLWLEEQARSKKRLLSYIIQSSNKLKEENGDEDSVEREYRRWKSGEVMPSYDLLDALFRKLYGSAKQKTEAEQKIEIACEIYYAIKRLDLFFITFFEKARENNVGVLVHSGYDSIQGWLEGRYDYWLQHWRSIPKNVS